MCMLSLCMYIYVCDVSISQDEDSSTTTEETPMIIETEVCMFMHIYIYDVRISQAEDSTTTKETVVSKVCTLYVYVLVCVLFKGYLCNPPKVLLHLKGMNIMPIRDASGNYYLMMMILGLVLS